MNLGDVIEIEWDDATGDSSWTTRGELEWPEMRCRTVGYFVQENEKAIMVCDSLFDDFLSPDGTIGGVTTIPKGMVVSVRVR